ncbi:EAL domain-containing protein [Neptuniibacter sp. QD29_5]|uniref:EAL domain-containing protein n=1 Tax=Neptuniibacter sp. QD29_5 TaxID=3398207 RepID=UPI0039F44ABF
MMKEVDLDEKETNLRQKAEQRLNKVGAKHSDAEKNKLLHELSVHQIELEMQNLALEDARIAQTEALNRYTELFEFAPLAYLVLNNDAEIISINLTGSTLLDNDRSELIGSKLTHFVCPTQRTKLVKTLAAVINSQLKESVDLSLSIGSKHIWVNLEVKPDSVPEHCLITMNDITANKKAETEMRLAAAVYGSLSEAVMVINTDFEIINVNKSFTVLTGYSHDEIIGQSPALIQSQTTNESQRPETLQHLWSNLYQGKWEGELNLIRKNGEEYTAQLSVSSIYDSKNLVTHRVATFSDISERKRLDNLILKQANYDLLTGLPNRQLFQDRLTQGLHLASRNQKKLVLLSLDIDKFKEVNDSFGHKIGDALLIEAATRLNGCIRETDTVARLGGDEFSIIMGELDDLSTILPVSNRILQVMAEPFQLNSSSAHVSVSIGVAVYPDDSKVDEELINDADNAMYAAKKQGRNRVHFFTQLLQEEINRKVYLNSELRQALSKHQLSVFYQPIVDLNTGKLHKAEALLRWNHPVLGCVSPDEFIPIAEDSDQITKIGDWVFHQVAQQVLAWRSDYNSGFQISLNKSPAQFSRSYNQEVWLNYLQRIGLDPNAIVIEITEGLLMDGSEQINQQLVQLNESGIDISLDDFGTGYSSLAYLKKFDVDYLKIDRVFVKDLEPGSDDMALCEAIIVMAHKLGIKVIAEGIETEMQRELLHTAGCDYGQGFLFSKAVSADQFEAILDSYS